MNCNIKEIFKPEALIASAKNEGLIKALINYSIIPVILGVILGVIALIGSLLAGDIVAGITALIVTPIVIAIGVSICALIINIIIFVGAKLVGGKAGFVEQTAKLSVIVKPLIALEVVIGIAMVISMALIILIIGIPLVIVVVAFAIAISMFSYHVMWIALKAIHQLDDMQLIKAITISSTLVVIVFGLAILAMIAIVGTALLALGSVIPMM